MVDTIETPIFLADKDEVEIIEVIASSGTEVGQVQVLEEVDQVIPKINAYLLYSSESEKVVGFDKEGYLQEFRDKIIDQVNIITGRYNLGKHLAPGAPNKILEEIERDFSSELVRTLLEENGANLYNHMNVGAAAVSKMNGRKYSWPRFFQSRGSVTLNIDNSKSFQPANIGAEVLRLATQPGQLEMMVNLYLAMDFYLNLSAQDRIDLDMVFSTLNSYQFYSELDGFTDSYSPAHTVINHIADTIKGKRGTGLPSAINMINKLTIGGKKTDDIARVIEAFNRFVNSQNDF